MTTEKQQQRGGEIVFPFNHTIDIQLRFNDIDSLGHVNNSTYFQLFDLAKARYFETVAGGNLDWRKANIVVANVNCNFLAPTFFSEPLVVDTQTEKIGNKSITLVQQLRNSDNGQVKCVCRTVMVGYDVSTQGVAEIAQDWKNAIATFEKRTL